MVHRDDWPSNQSIKSRGQWSHIEQWHLSSRKTSVCVHTTWIILVNNRIHSHNIYFNLLWPFHRWCFPCINVPCLHLRRHWSCKKNLPPYKPKTCMLLLRSTPRDDPCEYRLLIGFSVIYLWFVYRERMPGIKAMEEDHGGGYCWLRTSHKRTWLELSDTYIQ